MKEPLRATIEGIIVGVLSALLAIILFFIPMLNILVLLFPVPLVVVGVRHGTSAGLISLTVSAMLLGLFIYPHLGIIIFLMNVFIFLSLIVIYNKSLDMNESMVLSAGGTLLSILVTLQAFTWMTGKGFFDFLWDSIKTYFDANSANLQGVIQMYQALGIVDNIQSVDRFAEVLVGQLKDMVPLFPSMLLITSLLVGGANFLVSRFLLKKLRASVPYVPPFKKWSLPRGTGRGFLGLMLVAILGSWVKIPNFDVVLYTISSVFTFVFTVQGLSVVTFFLSQKRVPGIVGALILVAAFIFLSVALTFLGIFEQIFGVRRAYAGREGD